VYDLLNPSTAGNMDPSKGGKRGDKTDNMNDGLRIRWTKKEQFVVENLYICEVNSAKEVLDLFRYGSRNRVLAAHLLNEQSSRSHSIFSLTIES
jgi:hypothetical protein